jgi:hypothetical protein
VIVLVILVDRRQYADFVHNHHQKWKRYLVGGVNSKVDTAFW